MEEKCEIELTEGYHSINSRDVRLHIHKGKNAWVDAWVDQLYDKKLFSEICFIFDQSKCGKIHTSSTSFSDY